jgi:XTP/dITP diphosphohydrolase
MRLRCATTNRGKLAEFNLAAASAGIEILPLDNLKSLPECVEDGRTFEENAIKKALYYSAWTDDALIADDSGLEVDALGGEPGVRSARYSPQGTDAANNALLLENLRDEAIRTARFVCVIALARRGELIAVFHGEVEGRILDAPRGVAGFGYDPLFFYEPFGLTFGEASEESKLAVSHRGRAFERLLAYLQSNPS